MSNWFNEKEFDKQYNDEQQQQKDALVKKDLPYLQYKEVVTGTIEEIKAFKSSKKGTPGIEIVFVENEETENLKKIEGYNYPNRRFSTIQFYLTEKTLNPEMYFSPLRYFINIFSELGKREVFTEAFPQHPKDMDVDEVIEIIKDKCEGLEMCTIIGGEEYVRASDGEKRIKGVLNIAIPGKACTEDNIKFLNDYLELNSWRLLKKADNAPAPSTTPEVPDNSGDNFDDAPDDDLPF